MSQLPTPNLIEQSSQYDRNMLKQRLGIREISSFKSVRNILGFSDPMYDIQYIDATQSTPDEDFFVTLNPNLLNADILDNPEHNKEFIALGCLIVSLENPDIDDRQDLYAKLQELLTTAEGKEKFTEITKNFYRSIGSENEFFFLLDDQSAALAA